MLRIGTYSWDLHAGPFWTGSGERTVVQQINFSPPFPAGSAVQVVASLQSIDIANAHNARLGVYVQGITNTGFQLVLHTWADTQAWDAAAMWIAFA